MTDTFVEGMDFTNIDHFLNQIFGHQFISFEDLLEELMHGDLASIKEISLRYFYDIIFGNLEQCKSLFLGIFCLESLHCCYMDCLICFLIKKLRFFQAISYFYLFL